MEREKIICQGSIPEFENDGDELDRYYLPSRGLVLEGWQYLLPDNEMIADYAEQFNNIISQLNLPSRKVGFIPDYDYLLDRAIEDNLEVLKRCLSSSASYQVYPYAVTEPLLNWVEKLKREGFNIEPMFPEKIYFKNLHHPGHRGGWGRWINDPERISFPQASNLPYPTSWIGTSLEEVVEAYYRVCQETGTSSVIMKPIFSAGGFTLQVVSNEEDLMANYQNLKESGVLTLFGEEIPIEVQAIVDEITAFYSLQYVKGKLITPGGVCQQIIDRTRWQGNLFNLFNFPQMVLEQVVEIWDNFSRFYQDIENEWGGLDLALTEDERLIILEHNGQRITGAIPAIEVAYQLGVIKSSFATLKSPGNPACDLKTLWKCLSREKIAYDPVKKEGVFPIVWLSGSGMLFAVDDDPLALLNRAYERLEILGYLETNEKRANN